MTSELTAHEVVLPGLEELRVEVGAPADWEISVVEDPPFFLAQMPQALAGPFADNLIVNIERLGDDGPADLEELQSSTSAPACASLPDSAAVAARPHCAPRRPCWCRAPLQTAPPGIPAMNRQVFTLRGGPLVTLSLTTMAFRDPEASELFDALVGSCRLLSTREED